MLRDRGNRERVAILSRWRAATAIPPAPAAPSPARAPEAREAPAPPDEALLFLAFETELCAVVPAPLASVLRGWLAGPRDSFRSQPTDSHRAALLAALDRIEDALAAVLLTRARSAE